MPRLRNNSLGHMQSFREARKDMGMVQINTYVPEGRLIEFNIYVERMRAERMMELCDEPSNSPAKLALMSRYFTDVPDTRELAQRINDAASVPAAAKLFRAAKKHLEVSWQARAAMKHLENSGSDKEIVDVTCLAVANNAMAAALVKEGELIMTMAPLVGSELT